MPFGTSSRRLIAVVIIIISLCTAASTTAAKIIVFTTTTTTTAAAATATRALGAQSHGRQANTSEQCARGRPRRQVSGADVLD